MHNVTTKKRAKGINWDTAGFMGLFHLGAIGALFMFSWQALVVFASCNFCGSQERSNLSMRQRAEA